MYQNEWETNIGPKFSVQLKPGLFLLTDYYIERICFFNPIARGFKITVNAFV